jgi:hypothetical protein
MRALKFSLAVLLVLVGCVGPALTGDQAALKPSGVTSAPEIDVSPTSAEGYPNPDFEGKSPETTTQVDHATSASEAYPGPEVRETEPAPPAKAGLEATDPSSVELASGGPQLIEFFAFW